VKGLLASIPGSNLHSFEAICILQIEQIGPIFPITRAVFRRVDIQAARYRVEYDLTLRLSQSSPFAFNLTERLVTRIEICISNRSDSTRYCNLVTVQGSNWRSRGWESQLEEQALGCRTNDMAWKALRSRVEGTVARSSHPNFATPGPRSFPQLQRTLQCHTIPSLFDHCSCEQANYHLVRLWPFD